MPNIKRNLIYHPDYLGSVEYVTDMRGEPNQLARTAKLGGFFLNTPWGENVENQFARNYTAFSSRFRFNGKEWDEETGNFYYGARYYDPKISVWLSVDPLSSVAPGLTPYRFCFNNPVNIVDPTGLFETGYDLDPVTGKLSKATGENARLGDDRGVDVIIASDGSTQDVDKGVINESILSVPTTFDDGTTADVTTLDVSNIDRKEATDLYEWIANNTDDSYKLTHFSAFDDRGDPKDKRFISSSHIPAVNDREYEKSGEVVRKMMDGQGYFQTLDIWSVESIDRSGIRHNKRGYARVIQKWNEKQDAQEWKSQKIKCYYYIRGRKAPTRYY